MVWLIVKFSKPSGLSLLRILSNMLENNTVRSVYIKQVAHRTNIYAIETEDEAQLLEFLKLKDVKFEILAKADRIELVNWVPVEVTSKRYRNLIFGFETEFKFIKVGDRVTPLGRFNEAEWEEVTEQ